jgi:DNA-binding PadR family transcriptional regulator
MSQTTAGMVTLDERDCDVLAVLEDGRANPYLIREETGLGKGDVNTVLNRLGRSGYVRQVTTGLYEMTDEGRQALYDAQDVSREPVNTRRHETYEQSHWETAHIERVDNIGAFESVHREQTGEVLRVDLDGFGHGGASMHGVDDNVQISFWLTESKARALIESLSGVVDDLKEADDA